MKVWDLAGIELATPGTAVSLGSVARHVTDCAMQPGPTHDNSGLQKYLAETEWKRVSGQVSES